MDSSTTVNHDYLWQYMVNFNPMVLGIYCQVTIWSSIYNRKRISCLWQTYHINNGFQQMWEEIKKLWNYLFLGTHTVSTHGWSIEPVVRHQNMRLCVQVLPRPGIFDLSTVRPPVLAFRINASKKKTFTLWRLLFPCFLIR